MDSIGCMNRRIGVTRVGRVSVSYILRIIAVFAIVLVGQGCQDLTDMQTLPNGAVNPNEVKSAVAAYGLSRTAHATFQDAFANFVVNSGLLTDELQSNRRGGTMTPFGSAGSPSTLPDVLLDSRHAYFNVAVQSLYAELHQARGIAMQAIGALGRYAGDSSRARQGRLYVFAGYAEVMLADIYCSGIPLSTWDFERDFTYHPGATTAEVYRHAIALFDTALAFATDSTPIVHLAHLGKGRALLALGKFDSAATAVQDVPDDFVYAEPVYTCSNPRIQCTPGVNAAIFDLTHVSVSDTEGGRSVISPDNPRTAATIVDTTDYHFPVYFPVKYQRESVSVITLASGTEARLIRAEAALRAQDIPGWLGVLNALRTEHSATDTMPTLGDPGVANRADTMFAERAQWLFLTGHRQGDLRRRLRQDPSTIAASVYPTGGYPGGIVRYGNEVTLPIDYYDEGANPLFKGCIDRRP